MTYQEYLDQLVEEFNEVSGRNQRDQRRLIEIQGAVKALQALMEGCDEDA